MTKTKGNHTRFFGLAVRLFVIATVAAVILPLPEYARGLSNENYIVWLARLIWVLTLGFVLCVLLPLIGALVAKVKTITQKNRRS